MTPVDAQLPQCRLPGRWSSARLAAPCSVSSACLWHGCWGSMLFTTAACFAGVRLEVAPAVQTLMMIVLGLMIGSAFTPELLTGLPLWSVSLLTLPALIAVGAAVAWLYFRRLGRFDAVTAYFCASPGGMTDMVLLGGAMGGDVRAIGLTHAIRVFPGGHGGAVLVSPDHGCAARGARFRRRPRRDRRGGISGAGPGRGRGLPDRRAIAAAGAGLPRAVAGERRHTFGEPYRGAAAVGTGRHGAGRHRRRHRRPLRRHRHPPRTADTDAGRGLDRDLPGHGRRCGAGPGAADGFRLSPPCCSRSRPVAWRR